MEAPIAKDAAQGALDPELARTAIEIPWDDSMAAGDQITLRWIGTRADLTVYDPALPPHVITGREETNKLPININVDGTHLKTLDGGTLQLYFELAKDLNGSIVIRESARAFLLNVGTPRAELPIPIVAGVADGVMDPDLPGTTLTVPIYPNMEIGDEVHYLWKGSKTEELEDWIKINSFTKDKPVVFDIDAQFIADNDEGTIAASYWVIRVGNWRSDSEILNFQVGAGAVPLMPVPKVAGSEDGVLDLAEIPKGAKVVIAAWTPDMNVGDHVYMTWEDDLGKPPFLLDKSITGASNNKDVEFTVPLAEVTKNVGGNVRVTYRVELLAGDDRSSLPLTFDVENDLPVQLPPPAIVEAVGSLLDPGKVPNGANVSIPAEAQLKAGDSVTLNWAGQPGDGSVSPTKSVTTDGELLIPIPYVNVKANDGFSVTLSYTVKRADQSAEGPSPSSTYDIKSAIVAGLLNVMGARFSRSAYEASAKPRRISAFDKNTGATLNAEWQYEGDTGWTQATSWRDSRPWTPLHIRTREDHVVLSAVNIIGNGWAHVAHRDSGDLIGWGYAGFGGTIPPSIITLDDIVEVCSNRAAYAARRKNGDVVAWGSAREGGYLGTNPLDSYVALTSNGFAIAGIRTDGKVYAWGVEIAGGTVPDAVKAHSDITQVIGGEHAFAAIRGTGQVVAWGSPADGGTVPEDVATLTDIKEVSGNHGAFAALRANHRVVAWGAVDRGGRVTMEVADASVAELGAASHYAFSLITTSGQVLAWGNADQGGRVPAAIKSLTDIVEVSATSDAMAARRASGHVVAWGTAASGGEVPADIATLDDIVQVVGNAQAFAALRRNGTVVAWGYPALGGDTSSVVAQLINVKAVYANDQSFVALRSDGEIVTWGNADVGADSSAAQPYLKGRVSYETRLAVSTRALKAQAVASKKSRVSRTVSFSFAEWAKPQLPDAPGDVLDPGDDPEKMIKVHILPGALNYQDRVRLYLEDTLYDWTVVDRNGPGTGIDFEVPAGEFMVGAGGQVRVWYGVIPVGENDEQPSADLLLTISGGFEDDVTLDLTAHDYLFAEAKAPAQTPPGSAPIGPIT
ncbi:RCC1 domain-containing protein [Pseudomonas sp. NPDC088444]|uniref:RCC1 domain-containing protein n=1 Tax=Pseudomonas sp. NPDC088444 TaxID=3364456 RepID=UPI00384FDA76